MRSTLFIALICFLAPIAAVVAMYPEEARSGLDDLKVWAERTFPPPKPEPEPVRFR